jgi:hypothetical protein
MSKLLDALFGCSHKNHTFPMKAKPGQHLPSAAAMTGTYVVCLDCGKEFAYDWRQMKVVFSPKPKAIPEKAADSLPSRPRVA